MAFLRNTRERIHEERAFVLVSNGASEIWSAREQEFMLVSGMDSQSVVRGVRADVFIDENPDGQSVAFKNILAGFSIELTPNHQRTLSPMTFHKGSAATFFHLTIPERGRARPPEPDDDVTAARLEIGIIPGDDGEVDGMRHMVTESWGRPIQIYPRSQMRISARYQGPPVPVGFFRLVFIGTNIRDVQ